MSTINLTVETKALSDISDVTGGRDLKLLLQDAIVLLNWAVNARREGNQIITCTENGENLVRLTMPVLEIASALSKFGE